MGREVVPQNIKAVPREPQGERYVSYDMESLRPDWHTQAHCLGRGLDNYFGDEESQLTMGIKQVRQAAKLCDVCPVFTECLSWSLTQREEYGVWAGTSGRVRRRIFSLLDNGETTVEDVIEVFLNGGGERFRSQAAYVASRAWESADGGSGERRSSAS